MTLFCFLCALLFLTLTRCADDPLFEEKTFNVGQTVTLQCPRDSSETNAYLFWIRLHSGNLPQTLGGTASFNGSTSPKSLHPSIETRQEPGSFALSLKNTRLTDTGFYFCLKIQTVDKEMTFVKATFSQIKAPDPGLSVDSPDRSEEVHSGDSVDLQCWVQAENAQCVQEHMVLWFRSGQDQSGPGLVYAHRTGSGQCDRSQEDHGPHKCFYSFSKNMSRSDTGTYRCAVAACGHILFGNKTNVRVKSQVPFMADCVLQRGVIILLSVLLTISIIVITALVYSIKRKCGQCFSVGENTNKSDPNVAELRGSQRGAEVTYAAPSFNKVKTKKSRSRTVKAEEHVVYSDVRRGN